MGEKVMMVGVLIIGLSFVIGAFMLHWIIGLFVLGLVLLITGVMIESSKVEIRFNDFDDDEQ